MRYQLLQTMGRAVVFGWVWGVSAVLGHADDDLLTQGCRAFGREDYVTARGLLERYRAAAAADSTLADYYIGECYFKAGDEANAERWFGRAIEMEFNRQESFWRLAQIASNRTDLVAQRKWETAIEELKTEFERKRKAIVCWPPPNPDGTVTLPMVSVRRDGRSWAATYYRRGCLEHAITQMEHWQTCELEFEKRLRTEEELFAYQRLAIWCAELAERWEQEAQNPAEIEHVRLKARLASLRAMIVETRKAAGKLIRPTPSTTGPTY